MSDTPREKWLHDLHNSLNAIGVGVTVARRLLSDGDVERAMTFLERAELDCERCRQLMRTVQSSDDDAESICQG